MLEGPLDIVVPLESWGILDPEATRETEETRARLAWVWTGLMETRGSKDRKVCLALAKTAATGPTGSPGFLEILAFLALLGPRGPLASATPLPAKEP